MTKLFICSDIHTAFHADSGKSAINSLVSDGVDIAVIAGDLSTIDEVELNLTRFCDKYPHVVVSSKYYHQVLTTQTMLGRRFGWTECPSVSEAVDTRDPKVKRLMGFNSYGSDLKTIHRCCTSVTRDCETCHDGAATMSWVMVNKREHMQGPEAFAGWVDVTHMFAKLYEYIPW